MIVHCLLAAILLFQASSALESGSYITDGSDAEPGEFPYQASVQWGIPPLIPYRHICGGSILNDKYVLTAGHCILKIGKFRVAAGKHHVIKHDEGEQIINVAKTIVHKGYKGGVAQHDIALLKLKSPLTFNEKVAPVKLPAQDEKQTGEVVLTGWGSYSKRLLPRLPPTLQKAVIPLIENDVCLAKLRSQRVIFGKKAELYPTQICTGPAGSSVSACSGDSGGPLVQFVNDVPVQAGIVSWGMFPCGAGMPSVFTRVASYVHWINENMAEE